MPLITTESAQYIRAISLVCQGPEDDCRYFSKRFSKETANFSNPVSQCPYSKMTLYVTLCPQRTPLDISARGREQVMENGLQATYVLRDEKGAHLSQEFFWLNSCQNYAFASYYSCALVKEKMHKQLLRKLAQDVVVCLAKNAPLRPAER